MDSLPLGSRWEIFLDLDQLDNYLDKVVENPLISINNSEFGLLIGNLCPPYIYSCLIFKNARLTSASPFYFSMDCPLEAEIKKIEYSPAGEAYITLETENGEITAGAVDYAVHKKGYKKKTRLYLTAASYSFSRIDLIASIKKEFTSVQGFLKDEYSLLARIGKAEHPVYHPELPLTGISGLPVYAEKIYLKAPAEGEIGAGDIWLTCFTEDFAEILLNT